MTWPGVERGHIMLTDFDVGTGREQSGTRPAIVVASPLYLRSADQLALVVPLTRRRRGWANHVPVVGDGTGLRTESFAMTEQLTTVSRSRFLRHLGSADPQAMNLIYEWISAYLDLWFIEPVA